MITVDIHSMDMMPIMTTEDTEMVDVAEEAGDTGETMYVVWYHCGIPHGNPHVNLYGKSLDNHDGDYSLTLCAISHSVPFSIVVFVYFEHRIITEEVDTVSNSNIIRAEEVDNDITETIDEMDGDFKIGIHSNTTGRVAMAFLAAVIRSVSTVSGIPHILEIGFHGVLYARGSRHFTETVKFTVFVFY